MLSSAMTRFQELFLTATADIVKIKLDLSTTIAMKKYTCWAPCCCQSRDWEVDMQMDKVDDQ
uniref:Uncharacterized protein n=1 Tax=Romanomermis culicivorax TaxID=13658 RepID=A0A915I2M9_ROMCU